MSIKESITRSVNRSVLQSKKNSPHIFFVLGLGGIIVSTVLACRATLKLEDTLEEIKTDLEGPKELVHSAQTEELVGGSERKYSDREYYQDMTYVYAKGANKLIRLYGPAVVVGSFSIAALTGSHIQLTHRNAALTATLAAVSKAYDEYRDRVREELGEEKERDLYRGVSEEKIEVDGKKELVRVVNNGMSPYARFFEPSNRNWQNDMELNRIFIQLQQNYANHLLKARGHVFLNEVYDSLGLDRSQAGAVVGWVSDGEGDCYVDFGLFDAANIHFINGNSRGCLLDFNVDGIVYDKI
jgi:Family of unknown function (DUF6353)